MKFSLVLATINRDVEPFLLLESLEIQAYKNFEVVFVDQNEHDGLKSRLESSKDRFSFPITYIKIESRGLSHARNVGLGYVTGDIVAFPDDDCEYLADTLASVMELFVKHPDVDVIKGKIVNREGGNSLKKWGKKPFAIKPFRVFFTASSVTMFIKRATCPVVFDERFGAGSTYGSCEDVDLIHRLLALKKIAWYFPSVHIFHPHETIKALNKNKIINYGLGFGAYSKKNLNFSNLMVFVALLAYHFLHGCLAFVRMDMVLMRKRFWYISARMQGFMRYDS